MLVTISSFRAVVASKANISLLKSIISSVLVLNSACTLAAVAALSPNVVPAAIEASKITF